MNWRNKPKSFWQEKLTPLQFKVTREHGTEPAFSGEYYDNQEPGRYLCVCCESPLFESSSQFDSGSGWPSFFKPTETPNGDPIEYRTDKTWFATRAEVLCRVCEAHLWHVFDDGPMPTGKRYCINSAALTFKKKDHGEK